MNAKTWIRSAMLLPFFLLAACTSFEERMKQIQADVEKQYEPVRKIEREYQEKLASDPELAIIRGKPGISFNGCPVDAFDLTVPTSAERVALKKFGRLQQEYFDKVFQTESQVAQPKNFEDLGVRMRQKKTMDQHTQAAVAIYEGKITWAKYGQLCEAIDTNRFEQEVANQKGLWNEMLRKDQEYEKQRTEERRHRETIDAMRSRQGSGSSSTSCTYTNGGMICNTR